MPHILVEYSANLDGEIPAQQLVNALHSAALATGVFPIGGLRTRAARRDVYAVADEQPENAFVAVTVRMGHGRDADTRRGVADALMDALVAETAETFGRRGLGLTVDVEEIDPTASAKINNLHDRVAARRGLEAAK